MEAANNPGSQYQDAFDGCKLSQETPPCDSGDLEHVGPSLDAVIEHIEHTATRS